MATQTMQAMGPTIDTRMARKPLPAPPSPTLTNPDMLLPDEQRRLAYGSPPRAGSRRDDPPSPSYLRNPSNDLNRLRGGSDSASAMVTPKKEKLGLMSRKMMLLRSRTASNGVQVVAAEPVKDEFENFDSAYGSSPTLRSEDNFATYLTTPRLVDIGNLAPAQVEHRRTSAGGSSLGSDDMSSLPQFLAKYEAQSGTVTDDEDDEGTPTSPKYEESVDGRLEALQRQQEEDEHTSALLSQRAEQILANAKKRLNLMEGNLRGARDLVQPLTTANLKRATSVGSSYISPTRTYGTRNRPIYSSYNYQSPGNHRLQPQASAPNLDQNFHQGHWRGLSGGDLPDRPYTALEHNASPIVANGRIPSKAADPAWSNALKGSKSYDSLGALRQTSHREAAYAKGSPDSNLEPLTEDDGQYHAVSTPFHQSGYQHDGLGIYRPESRSDDLREQMSSLKGRISSLRERAREDSLRRQSMQNLREPSPLNNATANAPEFFYQSSPTYGQSPLDTNAGVGWSSQNNSPVVPTPSRFTGSRNAFAEEEQRQTQLQQQQKRPRQGSNGLPQKSGQKVRRPSKDIQSEREIGHHKRTPSGTAIVQSSKQRYSHHQQRSVDSTDSFVDARSVVASQPGQAQAIDDNQSETGESVYEDAEADQQAPVVAHEDRADAFDYKEFFLHNAMQVYGRRPSASSEASTTSTVTARGPTAAGADDESFIDDDGDDELDEYADEQTPASPETPERLREIERNLHKRTFSDESVSTMATFATATEGRGSPENDEPPDPKSPNFLNWPIPSTANNNSRPNTAIPIKHPSPMARSDSSSERADSGVGGLPPRSHSSQSSKRPALRSVVGQQKPGFSAIASPPMSPRSLVDPATVAVNALLAGNGRPLGLKDKALLFGLVESLSKVCRRLQDGEEGDYEGRVLRRRLDGARRALEGWNEERQ